MILIFMLIFPQVFGQDTWRYSNHRSEKDFTTRDSISLEYYGNDVVEWCYSSGCSLDRSNSKTASLHCDHPGIHPISPVRNETTVRYINIVNSPFCYDWYLVHYKTVNNKTTDVFRVWIVDPMHLSNEEKDMIVKSPSSFSAKLSKIFYKFGQEPTLALKSGYRSIQVPLSMISNGFNYNESYWEFQTTESIKTTQSVVWITGKSIALHDCFIRDGRIQLLQPNDVFSFDNQNPQVELKGESQHPKIITDPCSPHISVYISSNGFVVTLDNFKSTSSMFIPSSFLEGKDPIVIDAGFARNGNMVMILKSGIVIVYDRAKKQYTKATGLPGKISHLARILTNFDDCSINSKSFEVIAWSNLGDVFISSDGGYKFTNILWPLSSLVQDVVFHSFYKSFFFLMSNSTQPMIAEYSVEAKNWTQHTVTFTSFSHADDRSFTFLPQTSNFVLIWSSKDVFYGEIDGKGSALKIKTRDGTRPFTAGSNITAICTGWAGEFVIVLEDGRMFYGKSDVAYIVEIYSGEPSASKVSIMFDLNGLLLLVTNSSTGFGRRLVPLQNEITSGMFPDTECPYLQFSSNIPPELQYIDKDETKSFWVSLIYRRSSSNAIKHMFSSPSLFDVTVDDHLDFYPGMTMVNKTLIFSKTDKNNSYHQNSKFGKGTMSAIFEPVKSGLTCKDTSPKLLLLHAGCRPSRYLRIRNCTSKIRSMDIKDFTDFGTIVQCELVSRVDKQMTLLLDMYDGDRKVKAVKHDYIIWEENGKDGFTYSATMKQAGCIRQAQTWENMNTTANNKNISWHQNNYISCFSGDREVFDGSKPYEILNSTGVSRVVFTQSGLFVFTTKVIDPSLSFCTLTGRFTVKVDPSDDSKTFVPEIIAMCIVILVSLVLLFVSFWLYRHETLREHEQDRLTTERLQQLRSIYKGVRMSVDLTAGAAPHGFRRSSGAATLLMQAERRHSKLAEPLDTFAEEND